MAVGGGHRLEFGERTDLLGELLAQPDGLLQRTVARGEAVQLLLLLLLEGDEPVDAVQGHATVVADDAAASVGVGQAGHDARLAGGADLGGVGVEDTGVVGLAVLREDLLQFRGDRVAVRLQGAGDHPPAAVGHDRALERGVGLEADDQFPVTVDVAGGVRGDRRRDVVGDVEDALTALLREPVRDRPPHGGGALGGTGEEGVVALVGRVVVLDEVADVDGVAPQSALEALPGLAVPRGLRRSDSHRPHLPIGFT